MMNEGSKDSKAVISADDAPPVYARASDLTDGMQKIAFGQYPSPSVHACISYHFPGHTCENISFTADTKAVDMFKRAILTSSPSNTPSIGKHDFGALFITLPSDDLSDTQPRILLLMDAVAGRGSGLWSCPKRGYRRHYPPRCLTSCASPRRW